jgi:hypothetical protein
MRLASGRESGAYVTQGYGQNLRMMCVISPRIMQMLRAPAAQQGMLFFDPSVVIGLGYRKKLNFNLNYKLKKHLAYSEISLYLCYVQKYILSNVHRHDCK